MARRALGSAALKVTQAVSRSLSAITDAKSGQITVRVGVSGGADSLALAAGVAWCVKHQLAARVQVEALVVDHQLQPASGQVANQAVAVCKQLGLRAKTVKVQVAPSGEGVEAAARQVRYQALTSGLGSSDALLVGHTLDDQAETVLLGLARGSGTRTVAAMASKAMMCGIAVYRPLLGIRRTETEQACHQWGLEPWDDPTNSQPKYLRNRVRLEVMPLLEDVLGPGFAKALARTAQLAGEDADLLDKLATDSSAKALILGPAPDRLPRPGLSVSVLAGLPEALRTRVVRGWLSQFGIAVNFVQTASVLELVTSWHGQLGVPVPGGQNWLVIREGEGLWLDQGTDFARHAD